MLAVVLFDVLWIGMRLGPRESRHAAQILQKSQLGH